MDSATLKYIAVAGALCAAGFWAGRAALAFLLTRNREEAA